MPVRGTYAFETNASDLVVDNASNLEKLRKLFRDDQIIGGQWGPGNPGDFDHGAWHILCHLAGGIGVADTNEGRAWCGLTHVPAHDTYIASIAFRRAGALQTSAVSSAEGMAVASSAKWLGFIEGSSCGRISARGVRDAPTAFNHWPRQMFDQPITSAADGGTVWEHWSTTRDVRPSDKFGSAVLAAYLTLISHLGGRFIAAVARGRREHSHPVQLVALVKAGLLTPAEALWDVTPDPIPQAAQDLLYEARPADTLTAASELAFPAAAQRYYMFSRRIDRWNDTARVKRDLGL